MPVDKIGVSSRLVYFSLSNSIVQWTPPVRTPHSHTMRVCWKQAGIDLPVEINRSLLCHVTSYVMNSASLNKKRPKIGQFSKIRHVWGQSKYYKLNKNFWNGCYRKLIPRFETMGGRKSQSQSGTETGINWTSHVLNCSYTESSSSCRVRHGRRKEDCSFGV